MEDLENTINTEIRKTMYEACLELDQYFVDKLTKKIIQLIDNEKLTKCTDVKLAYCSCGGCL